MKLCIVGKYPPIEGGVSATTYWIARGLAQRGHEIHVVTNADEVEPMYRLSFVDDDSQWYQPVFPNGGRVFVHNVEKFNRRAMGHIPESNPFVSKLASVATDVVRQYDCDVLLGYYYEPYGVAAWLASRWTGCPLALKHAGSDLDRLFRIPDLATTYHEILRSAEIVVTQARLMPRFLHLGISTKQLRSDVPYSLSPEVFHPQVQPLRVAYDNHGYVRPPNGKCPTIGMYGKIGETKGTFDLIAGLSRLKSEGHDFELLFMIGTTQGELIRRPLEEAKIDTCTQILPMLPNWRVGSFIRACDAVCFLERDFPIAIHGPIIPREVFACGTCLILSGEIAAKQRYNELLEPGENVVIANDPKDHCELASCLRLAVTELEKRNSIGDAGARLSAMLEDHQAFVEGWEALLNELASQESTGRKALPIVVDSPIYSLESRIPELLLLLRQACPEVVETTLKQIDAPTASQFTAQFCSVLSNILAENEAPESFRLLEAVRYTQGRLLSIGGPKSSFSFPFVANRPSSRSGCRERNRLGPVSHIEQMVPDRRV